MFRCFLRPFSLNIMSSLANKKKKRFTVVITRITLIFHFSVREPVRVPLVRVILANLPWNYNVDDVLTSSVAVHYIMHERILLCFAEVWRYTFLVFKSVASFSFAFPFLPSAPRKSRGNFLQFHYTFLPSFYLHVFPLDN